MSPRRGDVTRPHRPPTEPVELTRPETSFGDGDHERFSHFVPKDKLMSAMVEGTPVIALCGKVWVPSRDPTAVPRMP
jgi:hypothetical protein